MPPVSLEPKAGAGQKRRGQERKRTKEGRGRDRQSLDPIPAIPAQVWAWNP